MASSGGDGSSFPIGGIVTAVFLVASAVLVQQLPYVASRPPTPEIAKQDFPAVQDVGARLWQDPLAAATEHRDAVRKAGRDGVDVARDLRRHTTRALVAQTRTLSATSVVMPVMVSGGPYSEDAEGRRRTRYAVVTALMRLGLSPRDAEHVAYFSPSETAGSSSFAPGLPEIVSYEWFDGARDGAATRADRVLVLWLDSSSLTKPLSALRELLLEAEICPTVTSAARAKIVVVGPSGSGELQSLMAEAASLSPQHPSSRCLAGAGFYSPFATALQGDERSRLKAHVDIDFFQMIASDQDLVLPLADELKRRGLDIESPEHIVAIVSELDTSYGRELSQTVQHGLCANTSPSCNCLTRIIPFEYLRGLDGIVPKRGEVKDDAPPGDKGGSSKPARPSPQDLERAEDQSQFDYLRRLADRMAAREIEELSSTRRRFKAIGILGSDVYDKLLVLQALRRSFPGALFFTTDLDARLLHPREFRWTRNLIVVSSHGLRLRDAAQIPVPPFRNNYQTATHLAATAGVISAVPGTLGPVSRDTLQAWIRQPHVFEIGRTEAVDLTPEGGNIGDYDADGFECRRSIANCPSIQPRPDRLYHVPPPALQWGLGAIAAAMLFLYLISSRVRVAVGRFVRWLFSWHHAAIVAGVGLAVLWVAWRAARAVLNDGPGGEPFRVLEGVSLWPTEIIRLAAGLAAVSFIIHVELARMYWNRVLTERYFPNIEPIDAPKFRHLIHPATWRAIFAGKPSIKKLIAQKVMDTEAEWRHHLYQSAPVAHGTRVLAGSLLFFIFGLCVFLAFGDAPHVPFRGGASQWIDRMILWFAVLGQIVLIFVVGDSIKLCDKYASCLAAPVPNRWPSATRALFSVPDQDSPLERWIDVRMMAEWTAGILHFIYFPFLVIFMMIIARSGLFDGWDVPWPLVIIFAASLVCAASCVVILRGAAERLRRLALDHLTTALVAVQGSAPDAALGRKLEMLIGEVRELRRGAFAPLSHQPLVSAAMLPLSGAGGVTLVEYMFLR